MADSFIQLSPDSTGKKVDTRTAPDGDHREVQVIGSPTTADVAEVDAANGLDVDVTRLPELPAGTNNIGDVDVLTVPAPLSTAGGGTEATALRVTVASDSTGVLSVDDNGGSLTVDGTVAVSGVVDTELPAAAALADNAANPTAPAVGAFGMVWDGVTWDRAAGTSVDGALVNLGANNDVTVAGVSTLAEQQTQTTHLAAIETAVELLDNAVAGTELQVDVVAPLPAGTNNIGDVDVLSVVPGTGATNLGKAVDSIPGATDTGVVPLAVRDDALATLTPADGDYTQLRVDSTGALWTRSTSAAGGTSATDEAAFTAGTSTGTPVMGAFDDVTPDVLAEGTLGIVRATTNRALHVNLRDASGNEVSPGGTQYAEDTPHVSGDQVTMAGVVQQTADAALGADGDRSLLQVDSSGFLKVNIKAGAGSGGTAMADDAAFTPAVTQGTPAFGVADETTPDSVDEGDAGALRMTLDRKLLTRVVGATDANRLDVDASGHAQVDIAAASVTVPISAASLPLPTGAATAANQLPDGHAVTVDNAAGASAVNVQDGGNSLTVDGSVSITGAVDTELPAAAALADATTNPTTPLIGAALETFNGTTWDRARGDTTNGLDVDVTRLPALVAGTANIGDVDVLTVPAPLSTTGGGTEATALRVTVANDSTGVLSVDDNGGSLTVDGTITANQGTAGTAWEVVGDVAADAAVPANPLTVGGRASTAVPTAVSADGDAVYNWLNRLGMQVVSAIPGLGLNADPLTLLSETAQYTTTQTSTVLVAGGASERIVVTSIQIQAGGTTAGTCQVYFGTGAYARGTDEAIFDGEFAPSATLKPGFFAAPPAGFRAGALGDDILVTTSAAINPLTITVWYYILGV